MNYPISDYSDNDLLSPNFDFDNPEYLQDLASGCYGSSFEHGRDDRSEDDEEADDDFLYEG